MLPARKAHTSFAGSAVRIVQEAVREDASVPKLAEIAGSDPGFSMKLLALVNSAAYGSRSVKTVQQAAGLLGIRGVRNLALSVIVSDLVPDGEDGRRLFEISIRRAVAARVVGMRVGFKDVDACFTMGLLLELGLIARAGDALADAARVAKAPAEERCVLERSLAWRAHPESGAAAVKEMNLPPEMAEAIASHHDEVPPESKFAQIAWAAERLAAVFEGPRVEVAKHAALAALAKIGLQLDEPDAIFAAIHEGVASAAQGFQRDIDAPSLENLMRDANRSLVAMNEHYESLVRTLERVVQEKQALAEELERLATTDQLTQVPNKRALDAQLKRDLARADRDKTFLSLLVCDVDHFKKFNDQYGHAVGDQVLQSVAKALESTLRASDFIGRFGGEEFVVILPATDTDGALLVADRLRQAVGAVSIAHPDGPLRVTASFGVATVKGPGCKEEAASLFEKSDRGLYKAKDAGRNCVMAG